MSLFNQQCELHLPMTHKQPHQPVSASSLQTRHVERDRDTKYSFRFNILSALMETLPLLLFLLASAASAASAASDQHVTVHPGHDVTLRCEAGDVSIRAVEWTRPDLEPDNVLFYSDGHYDTDQQHPSFTGRVELEDRELKDGDVSLTLKNVTSRDSGTYECRVAAGGSRRSKRANIDGDPIRVIYLEVRGAVKEHDMGGNKTSEHPVNATSSRGYIGVVLGVGVAAVLSVAAGVSYAFWRYKSHNDQKSEQSAADEAGNNQLMCPSAVSDSSS
ncbi:hypothetical protein ABVT39_004012 [Epinephelus coioides]